MAKRKKVEVEVLDFESTKEATSTIEQCEKKLEKASIAKLVAIGGSVVSVIGLFNANSTFGAIMLTVGLIAAIATYVMVGGIGVAMKSAFAFGKAAWFLIPIFPADLCVGLIGMIVAFYALFFLPIIIYGKIIKSINADLEAAQEYLANNQ